MITGELKSQIDRIWDAFWSGGIANPLEVMEQITYLLFTKTNSGGTDRVWFYDMQADGFSLDDKRNPLDGSKHENNNIPDILARWKRRAEEQSRTRTDQSFLVPKAEIAEKNYDLSINRYQEVAHEAVEYDPPQKILAELAAIECEIQVGLAELSVMLQDAS